MIEWEDWQLLFDRCEKALIVAAHPDDEVLGAGGTMRKLADGGAEVSVVFVATGIAARYDQPESHKEEIAREVEQLKRDVAEAGRLLGVKETFYLDLPDNRLDTVSRMDIARHLQRMSFEIEPDVVFTHHHGDYNWDHTVVHDASLMAFRSDPGAFSPRVLLSYEVPSATERAFQCAGSAFCPTVYVDVAATLEAKTTALACYRSEVRDYPHPRSVEAVKHAASKRGNEVGIEAAEAFQLIRTVA